MAEEQKISYKDTLFVAVEISYIDAETMSVQAAFEKALKEGNYRIIYRGKVYKVSAEDAKVLTPQQVIDRY